MAASLLRCIARPFTTGVRKKKAVATVSCQLWRRFSNEVAETERQQDPQSDSQSQTDQEEVDDRVFQSYKVDDFNELIIEDGDREKIDKLLGDYEFLKYTTDRAPSYITVRWMKELMAKRSQTEVIKYFEYMFQTEMAKLLAKRTRKRRGDLHRAKIAAQKDYPVGQLFDEETNEPIYRKWHNSLFMRIREIQFIEADDYKKRVAAMHGQPFVVDFSFEKYMTRSEVINTCDQLAYAYGENHKMHKEIFDLWFCNLKKDSLIYEKMKLTMPNLELPSTMISLEERNYTEIFPRERLCYLTPHARSTLTHFSHDDIYIMGGVVDKSFKTPVSLVKAKKEGIRVARLPLDDHVVWGAAAKVLTLNQIMAIMLECANNGGDWKDAFMKHVPRRKLKTPETIAEEEANRLKKLSFKKKKMYRL